MADILVQKPATGQTTTLTPQSEDRLVLDFDSSEATLTRQDDNLVMDFDDGSSITLSNFYEAYTAENMPTFVLEGAEVDGESFFAALGEELMPAAGVGQTGAQGSGSGVDTLQGTLLDGTSRLDGLDQEYPDAPQGSERVRHGGDNNDGGNTDPATTRVAPAPGEQSAPEDEAVILHEADLESGSAQATGHVELDFGSNGQASDNPFAWDIDSAPELKTSDNDAEVTWSHDGDDTSTLIGKDPDGNEVIRVEMDVNTGNYTVTLTQPVEHADESSESIEDLDFDFTLKDGEGNSSSGDISVTITDATPTDHADVTTNNTVFEDGAETGSATTLVELDFGADDGAGKTLEFGGSTFTYGEDGTWSSADGGVVNYGDDGDSFTLEAGGMTLGNSGDSDTWTTTVTGVPKDGSTSQDITITDADGDSQSLTVTAQHSSEESSNDLVGLEGTATELTPGTDYNVSIILDASGSMYHDKYGDIKGDDTRMDAACDAIIDLVTNTLHPHATSDLGGEVNLQIVTFWGYTKGDQAGDTPGLDIIIDGSLPLEQVLDDVIAQVNALRELTKDASSKDFHWQTHYENGFNAAADWFESEGIAGNGYENKVFFMSDGIPSHSNANGTTNSTQDKYDAYDRLEEAIGIERDSSGNIISGGENTIQAVGMGSGAKKDVLDDFDSSGNATVVTDANIANLFSPEAGNSSVAGTNASITLTLDGNDVVLGGTDVATLKQALIDQLGGNADVSDALLLDYIQNYPDWIDQNLTSSENDPDILLTGTGDDAVYGQGGDDVLIGDGDTSSLQEFAEDLGLNADDYTLENMNSGDTNTQELVTDLTAQAQAVDVETLTKAADALEKESDGNDALYGGEDDDILLGLGGDDALNGGSGNDILLGGSGNDSLMGGSGNDYLDGGSGADNLMGGSGNDVIRVDMDDVFVDGGMDVDGADMDVLLIDNASLDSIKDKMESGDITNMEVVIAGDVNGKTTDEVLQNSGAQDEDGNWLVNQENSGWESKGSQTIGGREYTEFTSQDDSVTILVESIKLETGAM